MNKSNYSSLFMKENRFNYFMSFLAQVIASIGNVMLAFMLKFLAEAVSEKDTGILAKAFIASGVLIFFMAISGLIQKTYLNRYIMKGLSSYKNHIFKTILKKDLSAYSDISSGGFINAFSNDLQLIEKNFIEGSVLIFYNIFQMIIALIVMTYFNIQLTIAVVIACTIPAFAALKFGNNLVKKEKQASNKNETFIDQTKDLLNGFVVIKSFRAEDQILKIFENKNFVLEDTKKERREADSSMQIVGMLAYVIINLVIIVYGCYLAFKGTIGLGTILAFIQLANYLAEPTKNLVPMVTKWRAAKGLVDKVINRLDCITVKEGDQRIDSFNKSICLHDLSFSYTGDEDAVKNLDIEFKKGGSYAVVGLSGSGKTTLFKLMQGFYNDYRGSLTVDGVEMKDISSDSLATMLGVIQQNVFLFNASLQDNITMFSDFPKEKIDDVVQKAGLSKLVNDKGYDYLCGDGGSNLSGGEQQRVSIARALLKNSSVLLMDEAMSALDNATAQEISDAVLAIPDITKILITHKLDERQLRKVDSIIVMKNGRAIEQGSFDELVNERGMFWSLYNVSGMGENNEEVLA